MERARPVPSRCGPASGRTGGADLSVHCFLCAHHCRIAPGERGLCGVRENRDGVLYTLVYGCPVSTAVDPIEKKPLFHFLPGTSSLSLATVGCNFTCSFLPERRDQPDAARPGPDRGHASRRAAGGRRGAGRADAPASPTPTPSRPSSTSTPATAPGWPRGRAQERLRHQRLHDGGDARRHRRRSARRQRRSQVVLRRVLPHVWWARGSSRCSTPSGGCTGWGSGWR